MPRRTRRIALFGEFGVGNIGNDTSLRTVLSLIHGQRLPGSTELITRQSEGAAELFGLPATPMKTEPGGREGTVGRVLRRARDGLRMIRTVGRFDAIVVPGTGLLEPTGTSRAAGTVNALAALSLAARLRRVPVVWFAVGGAVRGMERSGTITHIVVDVAARGASYRSYRDELTKSELLRFGVNVQADQVRRDVAFAYPNLPVRQRRPDGQPVIVAISVIDLPQSFGGSGDDRTRYVTELTKLTVELRGRGMRVRFVLGDQADDANTREVLAGLGSLGRSDDDVEYVETRTFDELLAELAEVDVVVASRFHVLVAAALVTRPMVALSHADKDDELLRQLGLTRYLLDAYTFDAAEAAKSVDESARADSEISARLRSECAANRAMVEAEFRKISDLLRSAVNGAVR